MKLTKLVFIGVFTALSTLGALAPATSAFATGGKHKDHKVTICHATNSATNPYTKNTVSYKSVVKKAGHNSHQHDGVAVSIDHAEQLKKSGKRWGDIIPELAKYNFAGMNLTTEGRTILANDCKFPAIVAKEPTKPNKPVKHNKSEKVVDNDKQPKSPPAVDKPVDNDQPKPSKGTTVVVSDKAAYTEEPRQAVTALPATGGIAALLIPVLGILAAGITYLITPVIRRIANQA